LSLAVIFSGSGSYSIMDFIYGKGSFILAVRTNRYRAKRRRRKTLFRILFLAALTAIMLLIGWLIGGTVRWLQDGGAHKAGGPYTIAVDAGHGGGDTGANAILRECDMTAQTAQALTDLLEADPNFHPVGTRADYDTAATPAQRSSEANRQHPDLLISIHGNSNAASADTTGFECYPVTPGRKQHDASMEFAALLVDGMQNLGAAIRGTNGIRYAYYDENDQKTIVDSSDSTERSETTFTVLERSSCPAVLVEQCFLTSQSDVDAFGDEDGCARCADCYYRAICAYFDITPYAVSSVSSAA
jgi:N-acetylmuramoyl-L-alanine amidase